MAQQIDAFQTRRSNHQIHLARLLQSLHGRLPAGPLWRRGQSVDRALSLRGELRYAPTERLVGGGTACAPPRCPLTLQRSEGLPKCGREPPTGGVWQRHFPRGPAAACCDKAPTTTTAIWDTSFQRRTQIVGPKTYVLRSRLVRQKPGLFFGEIAGGTHRLKPPHTRRYSPAVPPSCTPSQRCRPTRQLRAALSPSNFLQSHLKFPSQLTQVPTAVMQPSNPARSEEMTTSCAPNPVRNKEARPRT